MSKRAELQPTEQHRVMDLVKEAGIDVSQWSNFKGGAARAAANPKFCYEWAFTEEGKAVVLNLPYRDIIEEDGFVRHKVDLRDLERGYGAGNAVKRNRLQRLGEAIRKSFQQELPIRVIVFDGKLGDKDDPDAEATRVEKRKLDPVPWAVTSHDPGTGQSTLTRGVPAARFIDQFTLQDASEGAVERRAVLTHPFVRNADVRCRVLRRANGKCEYCHEPGFTTAAGQIYLETHHVIPLAEGGSDTEKNVAALCANHHREAHHGARREEMRELLGTTL